MLKSPIFFVLLLPLPLLHPAEDAGFEPLVKGDEIAQFDLVKLGEESIRIEAGEIQLTGKPNGYFATKESYRNYTLVFDWKYDRPEGLASESAFGGNSGVLLHVAEPLKVWPRSIEAQLAHEDAGHLFAIDGEFRGKKDAQAQKKALRPVGEWNHAEIVSDRGKLTCTINGVLIDRGEGARPDSGRIAWQSEGSPIRFRNLKLKRSE